MSSFSFTNRLIPLPDTSENSALIRQALREEVFQLQIVLTSLVIKKIPHSAECSELVDECLGFAFGAIDEHSSEKHKKIANDLRAVLACCEGLRLDASWSDILDAEMAPWFAALEICDATKALSFDKLSYTVSEESRIEKALAYKLDPNARWQDIAAAASSRSQEADKIREAMAMRDWTVPGVGSALLTGLVCNALEVRGEGIDIKILLQFLMKIEITPYPNVTLGEIGDRVRAWRAAQLEAVEARFQRKANTLLFEDYFEFALGYSFRSGRDDTDIHLDRTGS